MSNLKRGTQIKIGIIVSGFIILAVSLYLRSVGGSRSLPLLGVVLIIAGVIGFFFGGEEEDEIEQEDVDSQG